MLTYQEQLKRCTKSNLQTIVKSIQSVMRGKKIDNLDSEKINLLSKYRNVIGWFTLFKIFNNIINIFRRQS